MGIGVDWPCEILGDNAAGVSFQRMTTPSTKLKGVYDLRWEWVKELKNKDRIRAVKVSSDKNYADMLTKCYKPHEMTRMLKLMKVQTNY